MKHKHTRGAQYPARRNSEFTSIGRGKYEGGENYLDYEDAAPQLT